MYSDEKEENDDECDAPEEIGSDELLIDAVRSYPHLYNSSLKDFKDTLMKENSWGEVGII